VFSPVRVDFSDKKVSKTGKQDKIAKTISDSPSKMTRGLTIKLKCKVKEENSLLLENSPDKKSEVKECCKDSHESFNYSDSDEIDDEHLGIPCD